MLTLAYVGTQGHRLISQYDANPGDPALCLSLMGSGVAPGTPECGPNGQQTTYTRPDGSIVEGTRTFLGRHLGQATASLRISRIPTTTRFRFRWRERRPDVTFLAAYTYGKSIDNSSGFGEWVNFSNYRLSRSLSAFDVTHNFVASYIWALPFDHLFGPPGD